MRVLIAGGAGFVGSNLCGRLISLNHEVCCLDNLATGRRENIQHLERDGRFQFRFHDVTRFIDFQGPLDAVVHLASPASPVDYARLPIETLEAGSLGTRNTLELAKATGARFLLASTSEVYGDPTVNPQNEDYWGNVNPVGPRAVYVEAKRFAEALTLAYHRSHGLDTRITRIFNTYGPRMRPDDGRVISNFVVQALRSEDLTIYGDGIQTRSFCFVADLVEGLTRLLLSDAAAATSENLNSLEGLHGPINIGNPHEIRIKDIARLIIQLTGTTSRIAWRPLPAEDPKVRCPDITRAQALLGWQPRVNLEDGLAATIDYFRGVC
jgi:dTDP-glucose 4,6-dehydratase